MHSSRILKKVKDDYNLIAEEFSGTRNFPWKDFKWFDEYYSKNFTVLDLGCGNGRLIKYLEKMGYKDYLGVDQSKKLIEFAKKTHKNNNFLLDDISKLKKINNKYDVIFSIASFHHIPKKLQLSTLIKWRTHLKNDGYLFMTNWNLRQKKYLPLYLRSIIFPRFGFKGVMVPWGNKLRRYYFAFSKYRIEKLLKIAGYKVIFNEYIDGDKNANVFNAKNILTIARK